MKRAIPALFALVAMLAIPADTEAAGSHRAKRGHGQHAGKAVRQPPIRYPGPRTPTCRYADGTPFDPDIIGGLNHVGDGGPAGNLGGFNPCGY